MTHIASLLKCRHTSPAGLTSRYMRAEFRSGGNGEEHFRVLRIRGNENQSTMGMGRSNLRETSAKLCCALAMVSSSVTYCDVCADNRGNHLRCDIHSATKMPLPGGLDLFDFHHSHLVGITECW